MSTTPIYGFSDSSYKTIGGEAGVRALVDSFYNIMGTHKAYQPLFNLHSQDLATTKDKLARFLMGWLGGERTYQTTYGSLNIPMAHAHLDVSQELVDHWLSCMAQALKECQHDAEFSHYLIKQLAIPAARIRLVSQQHKTKPPLNLG